MSIELRPAPKRAKVLRQRLAAVIRAAIEDSFSAFRINLNRRSSERTSRREDFSDLNANRGQVVLRNAKPVRPMPLRTFDDAKVPFCAGPECLQRLFVIFAFVGSQRAFVTFKFNHNSPLL